MGGFVAVELATRHPGRVESLVLVDGGFPMATPPGLTPETVEAVFADRVGRLGRTWGSVDEYLDYFCSTAPLLDRDDPLLRTYVEHDLRDGRVRLSADALVADATSIFFGDVPWRDVGAPVRFLHAEWSTGRDSAPAYPPEAVERYAAVAQTVVGVEGVDHAGSIMSPRGAEATAALTREALRMTLLEALGREIPDDRLVTDADVVASLSGDDAEWAPVGKAAVALRARTEAEVAHAVRGLRRPRCPARAARRRHRPVRRRERRRRLRRARPVADDRGQGGRPRQPRLRRRAGHRQRRPQGGRGRAGAVVPARPGQRAVVDDRRQRRHQRRRAVLREVRRDPRLRARPARRDGRSGRLRQRRHPRPAYGEGRGGLRPDRADGRLRGHPRRRHRGDAAAAPRPGRQAAHRGRRLPQPRRRGHAPSPR